ncbi:MAG: phosphoglucosamine mutase [Bacillota bacterium]
MSKYFGTDGFRGRANESLKNEHAYKIGRFLGWYFSRGEHPARIVIGKDTRISGYMLEYSLVAGISASGGEPHMMHVTTTPSIAFIARTENFHAGIMISASHNEYCDNGIKLFNSQGEKFGEEFLSKIESYIDCDMLSLGITARDIPLAKPEKIGKVTDYFSGRNKYMAYLSGLATHSFKGVKVGLDGANGSAYAIARSVFSSLGAKVYMVGDNPNGKNINVNCGSTNLSALQKLVKSHNLDVGFAFDGDADRCLCVDENGEVINGDVVLFIYAKFLKERGRLFSNCVTTTEGSNFGLYKSLEEIGVKYSKTQVGDRYVYEDMVKFDKELGGEQSGHTIFRKYSTTGDGILTAMKIMQVMLEKKSSLATLAKEIKLYPQTMINVKVTNKEKSISDPDLNFAIMKVAKSLGENGRILVRKSGTEQLIRVLCESQNQELCDKYASVIAEIIKTKEGENE